MHPVRVRPDRASPYSRMPSDPDNPAALLQRLFVQHASHVRGFVVALLPDPSQADDVLQETFLTVTAKADAFDPSRDFVAWACGIARMKVREAGRRAAKRWRPLSDEVLDALAASVPADDAADERLAVLADCVGRLGPQSRRVIDLRYQQSHKPEEIARRMDWGVDSVYVALSRARAALRQCVERKLVERKPAAGGAA
jgi:RNA polymerase sigma-70 factor (ECF subfamily)